jgi:hypothetical protein
MSTLLAVTLACSGKAWASIDQTAHCPMQMADCHNQAAVITCCGPSAPVPIDRPALPQFARSPLHAVSAVLMDGCLFNPAARTGAHRQPSSDTRAVDRQLLHRSFVI